MRTAIRRAVSILMAAGIILSSILTGTLAWQGLSQTALNETKGQTEALSSVQLLKLEKLPDGTVTELPVPGAVFYLFTEDGQQIGGRYVTDKDGKISVELEPGNYYFEEIDPSPGYTFDTEADGSRKTRYPFTVTGEETDPVVVTAYNLRLHGMLTVSKIVENADGIPPAEFTFTVTFSDGGTYPCRIDGGEPVDVPSGGKFILKHGQSAVFENIPVGVTYSVTETPHPDYTMTGTGHRGNITEGGSTAVFVNTYAPAPLGSLTVVKEVKGNGADLLKEFIFTIVINGKTETFVLKHGESKTFPDLPVGTQYTVTETDYTADGYVASVKTYTGTFTGEEALLLPFVNVYDSQPEDKTGRLEIEKKVIGDNADPNKVFTFKVTFSDGGTYWYRIDSGIPQQLQSGGTLALRHTQKALFEGIPAGVSYTVQEIDPAGYLPDVDMAGGTIVGDETAFVLFQNRVPEDPAKIRVTKELAGEYPEADLNKEFHFTLIVDGVETKFTLKPGESIEFEVPPGAHYEVWEDDYFADGYTQSIVNGIGTVTAGQLVEVKVTNTFEGIVYTEIKGEKTWDLGDSPDTVLPGSIMVRLMHNGLLVEAQIVTPDENGEWHYAFTAPKYDADGKEIQYTIEEVPLDSFIPSYDGFNIINTYIPPVLFDPPIIQKVVNGENPPETQFAFLLKGESGAPMPEGSNESTKVVTMNGSGEAELGEITFIKAGVYTYTLSELNGGAEGWTYDNTVYTLTVTVTEQDGGLAVSHTLVKNGETAATAVFTNTYETPKPIEDTVVVAGQKTWHHGDNPADKQPNAIIVQVYADGTLLVQRQVTQQDNWQYSFELPKYAADGHQIVYTIDEADVPGYDKVVDGYDLINTYSPGASGNSGSPLETDSPPSTGDNTNLWLPLVMMFLSLTGFIVTVLLGKRKTSSR